VFNVAQTAESAVSQDAILRCVGRSNACENLPIGNRQNGRLGSLRYAKRIPVTSLTDSMDTNPGLHARFDEGKQKATKQQIFIQLRALATDWVF